MVSGPDKHATNPSLLCHNPVNPDIGHGLDVGPRIPGGGLLPCGDRKREPLKGVHVRFLHPTEELPGLARSRRNLFYPDPGYEQDSFTS